MKKNILIIIFVYTFLASTFVFAGSFDYEVDIIREKIRKLSERNILLTGETKLLKENVESLHKELDKLKKELYKTKNEIVAKRKEQKRLSEKSASEVLLLKEQEARLRQDSLQVSKELVRLEQELNIRQKQSEEFESNMSDINKQIDDLRNKVASLGDEDNRQKEMILREIRKSEKNLKIAKRKFKQINKKHKKPLNEVNNLKSDNFALKQKLIVNQNSLNVLLEKERIYFNEYSNLSGVNKNRSKGADNKIIKLTSQKEKLEDILEEANNRLKSKNLRLDLSEQRQGLKDLSSRLKTIKDENEALKKKFTILREALESVE
ncbi:MAG: hypothetical protein P9X22_00940 [Candidatus Zapsychrus exili]|nr:hypothetical protein [Candidatus Zapsychrus exili]